MSLVPSIDVRIASEWDSIDSGVAMNQQPQKLAYTVGEAAKLLSLSRSFLYEAIQAGKLQSFKVGGARRISARQLQDYLEKQERSS